MLTYVLAWVITLGSLGLYLATFLFPEVHRKNDFIWGGVGFFYALILWANAKTMPGGLLIGQIASVSLIVWLGQENLRQRQLLAPANSPLPAPGSISDRLRRLVIKVWRLIAQALTAIGEGIARLLENPQTAKISNIEVGIREEAKTGFLNQLTNPLTNLSGNLTGLFKSGAKSPATINTVTVKATSAPDDAEEDNATPVVTEKEAGETQKQEAPQPPPETSVGVNATPVVIEKEAGETTQKQEAPQPPPETSEEVNATPVVTEQEASETKQKLETPQHPPETSVGVNATPVVIEKETDATTQKQEAPHPPPETSEGVNATPVVTEQEAGETTQRKEAPKATPETSTGVESSAEVETSPTKIDAPPPAENRIKPLDRAETKETSSNSSMPPSTATTGLGTTSMDAANERDAGVEETTATNDEQESSESIPQPPTVIKELETTPVEVNAVNEATHVFQDAIATPIDPIDPQSAWPPIEIATDTPAKATEAVEAAVPPVEVPPETIPVKTAPELPEIHRQEGETAVPKENTEIQEQSSNTAEATEVVEAAAPPVEVPPEAIPVKTAPELPEIYRQESKTAAPEEKIEIKDQTSSTEAMSTEQESAQPAITGGDLQPETKPEEWTAADPLA